VSLTGLVLVALVMVWPGRGLSFGPEHGPTAWPSRWPAWGLAVVVLVLVGSTVGVDRKGKLELQARWAGSVHTFTWGAGIEAMRSSSSP
jgi:hypothetical protein